MEQIWYLLLLVWEVELEQVQLHKSDQVKELLEYYMGKNTMERQTFIINHLVVEEDPVDDASGEA